MHTLSQDARRLGPMHKAPDPRVDVALYFVSLQTHSQHKCSVQLCCKKCILQLCALFSDDLLPQL